MKILSKISALFIAAGLFFASCSKENVDVMNVEDPNFRPDTVDVNPLLKNMNSFSNDTIYLSCIAIPFPVDFKQMSGNTITLSNQSDFQAAMLNPDSLVDFVYPFLTVVKGSPVVINKPDDLVSALILCSSGTATCSDYQAHALLFYSALNIFTVNRYDYSINYPVDLIINGQTITLNQDSDYLPAIGNNPARIPDADLVYPVSVSQFGQTITMNSDQEVCDFHETLNEDCVNKPAHIQFFFNEGGGTPISCAYFISYPVDVDFNGTQLTMQSQSDYTTLLNGNPNVYSGLTLVYPVNATKIENGQQLSFSSDADVCQYLDTCF